MSIVFIAYSIILGIAMAFCVILSMREIGLKPRKIESENANKSKILSDYINDGIKEAADFLQRSDDRLWAGKISAYNDILYFLEEQDIDIIKKE